MSTVLAYTSPARGHLYPATAILLELQRRGHHIAIRTLGSQVEAMRRLGFDASSLDPRIERIVEPLDLPRGKVAALKKSIGVFAERAPFESADLQGALEQHRPDLVLVDVNSWGGLARAEHWAATTGRPWVELFPYTPAIPSRDTPPFGPGLAPARGGPGRVRDRILRPLVFGALERAVLPLLNPVRRDVGVPDVANATEMFTTAPLMLITTAEPFEYPRTDWPRQVVLTGPCDWEPPAPAPAWLAEITDPIVLVTTSSEAQADEDLVRVAFEALADEPVHVVATVPAGIRKTYTVPTNAHLGEFIPHGPLLGKAVVAVTHGGMGATQKALARGVPVCVVPFGRDQHEVARRVSECGAGTVLRAGALRPDRLRAAIAAARNCRPSAREIQAAFAAAGGAASAADAIDRLVTVPGRTRP